MGPGQAQGGGISNSAMAPSADCLMSGALSGDDWQPERIAHEAIASTPDNDPQGFARTILHHAAARETAMNKENIAANSQYGMPPPANTQRQALGPSKLHMIDRQPNAQRVEWEDPGFSQDVASSSRRPKRDHASAMEEDDMEPDPSQDEGFQQDSRSQDIAAKRRSKPGAGSKKTGPQQRAPKRARARNSQAQGEAENVEIATTVTDYNQAGSPAPSSLDIYQATHDRALTVTASQPKKVQVRRAWTDEETQTLLELIEAHGTSWRLLKDIDQKNGFVLQGRDQVALKDKARNMKLDFLK